VHNQFLEDVKELVKGRDALGLKLFEEESFVAHGSVLPQLTCKPLFLFPNEGG
jgi:hypothetical protein